MVVNLMRSWLVTLGIGAFLALPPGAAAQAPAQAQPQTPVLAPQPVHVTVVGTTPLPGVEQPVDQVPAPVQTSTAADLDRSGALDLSEFMGRRLQGVHINEMQGNPFQPDVNYRGYTASPLLGTPQGLSVYMDGVRLNQPFGEVVSWDLIPRIAIRSTTLMPGSNPMFGLNTLGGAIALETKDGRAHRGGTVQATYGSDLRRAVEFEHGGQTRSGTFNWYAAANLFGEDGWRDDSPSKVRQFFGKLGWQRDRADATISVGHANNALTGNGLQDFRMLGRDYASIYTRPDTTDNRSTLITFSTRRQLNAQLSFMANASYRHIRTTTLNGDINEDALDQDLYEPGTDASDTPFPSLRCIGTARLEDDDASEMCNGLINQTHTSQHNGGASGQITHRRAMGLRENVFTAGGGFDRSAVAFAQFSELGYLNPDRSVAGVGVEPADTRVGLDGRASTWSVYATDTLPIGLRTHMTLAGRYDRTSLHNRDRIEPGGGPASLDGDHVFQRFNPAAGITIDLSPSVNAYASYGEGSRAATSVELGCANPEEPCKLPNAMAGDPPLKQVVTRTLEGGVRGTVHRVAWYAGAFRAANRDDILFVTSEQTGFGYFRNIGRTRRQGFDVGARTQAGRLTFGIGYTFLRATFESEETVNGESNSANDTAKDGEPGLEGAIAVEPGNRMPLIPQHLLKIFGSVQATPRFSVDADLIASGGSFARGNENNRHEPDGTYYLGGGTVDGYAIVNLGAHYALNRKLQLVGHVTNLLDRRYATGAQLGPAGFTAEGTFVARPLPAINGEFPLRHTTFIAAGAPRRAWVGMRVGF